MALRSPSRERRGVLVVAAIHLALTLFLAARLNLWRDEVYSLHTTSGGLRLAWLRALNFEMQPPFYFVALRVWRLAGGGIFFARVLSVLCGFLAVYSILPLARRFLPGLPAACIAAAFAFHPLTIASAVEIRLYAFALLLSSGLLVTFFDGYLKEPEERWARRAHAVLGLVALYTQYYLGFLLAAGAVSLLVVRKWRSLRHYLFHMLGVGLAFAPMGLIIPSQVTNHTGTVRVPLSLKYTARLIAWRIHAFVLPDAWAPEILSWAVFLSFGVALALGLVLLFRRGVSSRVLATWSLAATVAVLFSCVLRVTGEELFEPRHSAALFLPVILVVWGVADAAGRKVALALTILSVTFAAFSLAYTYRALAKDGDVERVARYLQERERPGEPIVVFPSENAAVLGYYYRGPNVIVPVPWRPDPERFDPREFVLHDADEFWKALGGELAPGSELWIVTFGPRTFLQISYNHDLLERLIASGFVVEEERAFFKARVRHLRRREALGVARGSVPAELTLWSAPGLTASATFVIPTPAPLPGWRFDPGDLTGAGAEMIPASQVLVRRILPVRLEAPGGDSIVPEWLVPVTEPVADGGSGAPGYGVTVSVPKDALPGVYRGAVVWTSPWGSRPIGVRLEVRPLDVQAPRCHFAMLYTREWGVEGRRAPPDARRARALAVAQDLKDHGMTAFFPEVGDSQELNDLRESFEGAWRAGLRDAPGIYVGHMVHAPYAEVPQFEERRDPARLRTIAEAAGRAAHAEGFDGLVVVPADEPNDPDGRKLPVARLLLGVLQGLPGVRTGVTSGEERFDAIRSLASLHRVSILASMAPPDLREELRRSGHEVWLYDNASALGHEPGWSRFVFGVWGWRSGAMGITAWTHPLFSYAPYFERPRTDALGRPIPAWDAASHPMSTLEWEGIREGVVDRRYVDTLAAAIEAARGAGLAQAAQSAQSVLDTLWNDLRPALSDYRTSSAQWSAAHLDATRERLAEATLALAARVRGTERAPTRPKTPETP
jgi:mannosyltransferase